MFPEHIKIISDFHVTVVMAPEYSALPSQELFKL